MCPRVPAPRRIGLALTILLLSAVIGCGRGRADGDVGGGPSPTRAGGDRRAGNVSELYRDAGLIAAGAPLAFVGDAYAIAGPSADTSLVLLALSLPNTSLTFVRDGERYRAAYEVRADVRRGAERVRQIEAREQVRVATSREAARSDESVIFQQLVPLVPGTYQLALSVRDIESGRIGTVSTEIDVPRLDSGALSTPIPVHEATRRPARDSAPSLIAMPRATVVFGRDTVAPLYVEAYGDDSTDRLPVLVRVHNVEGALMFSDTLSLARHNALFGGVLELPVARLGIGLATITVARLDAPDSTRAPVFVGFGEDLPLVGFSDLVEYLQYFASAQRLRPLRDTTPEHRADAWAAFLRETDPILSTPENEALRDYFQRVAVANRRFRDEGGAGWRTDRGKVFIGLGEPDQILEQSRGGMAQRGRAQLWEYREHRARLIFIDQSGFGRYELTPSSEAEFRTVLRRIQQNR